ncbi:MAG: hypothetical protein WBK91_11090 [Alphaproteobacteria bacterium]
MPNPGTAADFFWRPGFWIFNGHRFAWVKGHYIRRPAATALWSLDHWEQRQYGWVFIPGYWQ